MSREHNWKTCKCKDCADLHYDYNEKNADYTDYESSGDEE